MKHTKMIAWIITMALLLGSIAIPAGAEEAAVKVGEYITFGTYEQDNDLENGPEPIEWVVLEVKDGRAFLLSRYVLEFMRYHNNITADSSITWETWDLRAWLNGEFMDAAFTAEEKAKIPEVKVQAHPAEGGVYAGLPTTDRVFLLSFVEVGKYLPLEVGKDKVWEAERSGIPLDEAEKWELLTGDSHAKCRATPYAVASAEARMGHAIDNGSGWMPCDRGNCQWWLRSPGGFPGSASYVTLNGRRSWMEINRIDKYIENDGIGVRPAMWIELEP